MHSLNLIKTILIEGNIGVGKSTIMSHIASTYPSSLIQVHHEPVENWTNIKGFDLLKALYTESNRWTFAFEMTALLSRIKNHLNAVNNNNNNNHIHLYERSILSCFHVFIRHDLEQNYLNGAEYKILQDYFEYSRQKTMNLSQTVIFYFDLSSKQCLERIIKRSRQSELNIDLKRLEQIKHYYDEFIKNFNLCPIKIIDASQPIEQIRQQVDSLLNQFIKQNQIHDMTHNKQSSIMTKLES
ncbi:unnamed protein product [Rotaria sordida]|uniref:Deoxynucleoside kinase domain-containing protein n=2 Tax=Rotaria sordida TaxID=392033 RepID=A0A819LXT0_9BILA|nr:unnamed protein product [Rotaria sordida]